MIGTDHGRDDPCLVFAATSQAHGMVPTAATVTPVRIARNAMGRHSQSLWMVIVLQPSLQKPPYKAP